MVFFVVEEVVLGFYEVGGEEDVGAEGGEEGVKGGGGGGCEGWEGAWGLGLGMVNGEGGRGEAYRASFVREWLRRIGNG